MTITPLSPLEGTLQQWEPPPQIPDHIAAGDEAVFVAQMLEWRRRILAGKETQNDRQLIEGWLGDCTPTSSVETVKTYRRHIERLRLFLRQWNEAPLREQPDERFLAPGDPEAIDAFAGSLRNLVHATDEQGSPHPQMSVSTYNVIVAAVSSFYKWCSQPNRRAFTSVPLSPVPSGLQLKKAARKAKALSHEQLHQVYFGARQCRTSPSRSRDELIVRLLYLLGTRATETANLRWEDLVQLETGPAIHVRAETAKGKKERFIALGQPAIDVLEALRLVQPASPWILPNLRHPDRHVSRQGLWKLCRRAGDQVGVKFWTHCARHTHATHAYAITKDPKLIQNTLGHSDVSTTLSLYVDETAGDSSSKYLE